ncbi:hypothetical protein [Pendulispora albinea]|uniref:Uncharacterized protein n=1 Tax=Pendulispora albinea TaxID=2741071 RepID=A0ABZ2LIW9_9BACT
MASYPNRHKGGRLVSWLFLAWLAATVMAGGVLASVTYVDVAAFYSTGHAVYMLGSGAAPAGSEDGAKDEVRAAARVKIQIRPWASQRTFGKLAGAVTLGSVSGVRWHLRARMPGKTRSWPASERQAMLSNDCV